MISRRLLVAAACLLAGMLATPGQSFSAGATDDGPGAFVTRLGNKTIAKLTDASVPPAAREGQFRELLREGFDVDTIGQFVLGKYRRSAPKETVVKFIDVFEEYIVSLYAKQFGRYSGETFVVEKVADTSRRGDSIVMTKIIPTGGAEPLRVDFQVRNFGNTFKILDVRVEGVSMVLAQRDEFTSYIAQHDGRVESLIDALRQRIAGSAAAAAAQ
jgi:phospholipid transport system substrate-binding protein